MQHSIPVEQFGPEGQIMARAVSACVHCGFCLSACPTYQLLEEEMDSPRGRIVLMKEVLEGRLAAGEALPYIDRCLGCQACVPACPSGVPYGELLVTFRGQTGARRKTGDPPSSVFHRLLQETLPYPARFRLAARVGRWGSRFAGLLPESLSAMVTLLPDSLPPARPLPTLYPAEGKRRARVALLAGCVQQVLAPEINWATLRALARNGVETVIPGAQGCCGALSMHIGKVTRARAFAAANMRAFPEDVDAIITNAAGCGSGMREYEILFAGRTEAETARAFARRVRDVSVFLDELGLVSPPPLTQPLVVAYHDACHLAHAQGITEEPRRLLASIPNLTLIEIGEGTHGDAPLQCCGSAGT
ncbi:MAG: (Fe-S)-binding protein, partial [Ardenticatenaceae bacterium]